MLEYNVDLSGVRSYEDLIEAFNVGLIRSCGGEWTGNLDAFNDYLAWPESFPYRLKLAGWESCYAALKSDIAPGGQSRIDIIREILADERDVDVVCG